MHMVHDSALSGIDLNLLVVLRALLTERHVTRAAARVGLSQSATSHALARLRELYGDPLLVRSGRALSLTPRAARLLPAVERGLGELENTMRDEPEFQPSTARRTFTLGMADYLQALIIGPLLQKVAKRAPGIDLSVVVFPNLRELVESGSVDLALTVSSADLRGLSHEPLFEEGFMCMVRRGHPRIRKTLTLASYLAERHVAIAPGGTPGTLVDTVLAQHGLERRIALRVTNFLIAPVVVSQTDFINTMPTRLARQLASTYALRLVPSPIELPVFEYCMTWHPRLDRDPAQHWLRDIVATATKAG
ncbi:MAG TPA: LysR family transcriptional regulator [Polyangiaceae bacterium]|nr:LysR family transcriptional regulator [Polyangiaceae bacterium]